MSDIFDRISNTALVEEHQDDIFDTISPPDIFDKVAKVSSVAEAEPPQEFGLEETPDYSMPHVSQLPGAALYAPEDPQGQLIPLEPGRIARTLGRGMELGARGGKRVINAAIIKPVRKLYEGSSLAELDMALALIDDKEFGEYLNQPPEKDEKGRTVIDFDKINEFARKAKQRTRERTAKAMPGFKIPAPETPTEKTTDIIGNVVGGVGGFTGRIVLLKKMLGGGGAIRDTLAWELENQFMGGQVGKGAAIRGSLGAIAKIPTGSVTGKVAKVAAQSGLFSTATAISGGDKEDIIVSALIPVAFNSWHFIKQKQYITNYERGLKQASYQEYQNRIKKGMPEPTSAAHLKADQRLIVDAVAKAKQTIYRDNAFATTKEKWELQRQKALKMIASGDPKKVQQGNDILDFIKRKPAEVPPTPIETQIKQIRQTAKAVRGEKFKLPKEVAKEAARPTPAKPGLEAIAEQLPKPVVTPLEAAVAPPVAVTPKKGIKVPPEAITEGKVEKVEKFYQIETRNKILPSKKNDIYREYEYPDGTKYVAKRVGNNWEITKWDSLAKAIPELQKTENILGAKEWESPLGTVKYKKAKLEDILPPAAEAAKPAAKEPWEMTEADFRKTFYGNTSSVKIKDEPITIIGRYQRGKGVKSAKFTSNFGLLGKKYGTFEAAVAGVHKDIIRANLSEGKPVPREVLEEYKSEKWAQEALAKGEKPAEPIPIKIPENLRDMTDEQLEQSIYRMLERPLSKAEKATLTKLKRESSRRDRVAEKDTTGISRQRRTQLVTRLEKDIAESEIYKAAEEGLDALEREIGPGFYFVPKKFQEEVEQVVGKVKGLPTKLQKMFTFKPEDLAKGAIDFERAVQSGLWKETELGETVSDSYMDPGEFAQRVKDAVEGRAKVGGLNLAALVQAEKSGDPYIQYKIAKAEMLRAGHSAQEIDEMTAEWAKDYELSEDILDQEWVGEEPKKLKEIKQIKDEDEQDRQLEILARESVLRQEREEAAQNVNQVLKANDLKDAVEVEEVEEIEPKDDIPFERRGEPTGATFITPAGREIVQLAYGADSGTGYHEAYHVLRRRLTPKDIKILEIRFKGNQEAEAEVFAEYAKTGRVQKSYLRNVWQKLRLILQRIRNTLQGLGYRSINDIFGEIETGGIAKVEARPGAVRYEKGVFDQPIHKQLRLPLSKRQAAIKRIEAQEKVEAKKPAKPTAKPYEYWRPLGRVRIKSKLVKAVDAEIARTMKPRSNTVQVTPEQIAMKLGGLFGAADFFYEHTADGQLAEVQEAFAQIVRGGPLFDLRYRVKFYKTADQARSARIKAEKERLRKVGGLARRRRAPKIRRLKIQVDAKATPALAEQWIEGAPRPPIPPPPTKTPVQGQEFSPEWYQANIKGQRTKNVFAGIAELVGEGVKGLDKAMFSSSTRLKVISPELFRRTRKYAWSVRQRFADMVDDVKPFIKATKRMSKNDWKVLDLAMKNRDRRMIYELLAKYDTKHDTLAKYESVRDVLDEIYEGANEVGIDMGYLHEYWHRFVKDKKGFLKYFQQSEHWSAIMEAIKSKARRSGRKIEDITDDEKILVINSMLRGYRSSAITLSRPGAAKERIIEVIDDKLNRYYGDSREALVRYIRIMNTKIAAREFFGGETREIRQIRGNQSARLTRLAKYRKGEGLAATADKARYKDAIKRTEEALAADGERLERLRARPLEETVGGYVFDLWQAGVIDPTKEREIVGLLKGIFDPKSTGRAMSFIKTSIYLDTLNSFIHAITQLEELAFAFYRSPHRAIPAMVRAVVRKSQIRPTDIGIQTVGVEFESQSMERALRTMLRANLFTWADHLGKETLINTELNKLKRQAMSKKEKPALVRKLTLAFGKNYKEVIEDLKRTKMENLKRGDIPDRIKYLLFSEVADIHPIAETEMPEYYNRAGNLRILYTLKTFYLKRFDYLRNEAFRDMKSIKTFPRGFGKMVWMLGWFALLGAGTDWLKDFMLGRAFDLKDSIVDTLARVGLLSKYEIYAVERQKPSEFVARKLSPPMKWEDAVWRDVKSITKDKHRGFEIWRSVPVVGEFYYWWFGRGRERIEERRGRKPTRPTRPTR